VGISDIIVKPGLVNVDFADVRTILMNSGMVNSSDDKLIFFSYCI
jgi:cell division GTPase FtsZ